MGSPTWQNEWQNEWLTPVRERFSGKLEECRLRSTDGRTFYKVVTLKEWMTTAEPGESRTNMELLEQAVKDHIIPFPSQIDQGKSWAARLNWTNSHRPHALIFAILLSLGLESLTYVFVAANITDQNLELSHWNVGLKEQLEEWNMQCYHGSIDIFSERVREFCPVQLRLPMTGSFDGSYILPFFGHTGGSLFPSITKVRVPEEFVCEALRTAIPHAQSIDPAIYTFMVKTFDYESYGDYVEEINYRDTLAYKDQDARGIIRYLGQYKIENEFHQLLECAEWNLDAFFSLETPPVVMEEINSFWVNLFSLSDAIASLHEISLEEGREHSRWHGIVNFYSILVVDRRLFKLECFGKTDLSGNWGPLHFKGLLVKAAFSSRIELDYVALNVDVWSLGIVLLLAATWLHVSRKEWCKLNIFGMSDLADWEYYSRTIPEDLFYNDSSKYFRNIVQWVDTVRRHLRDFDQVSKAVLDLVENYMLVASERINSAEVCRRLSAVSTDFAGVAQHTSPSNCDPPSPALPQLESQTKDPRREEEASPSAEAARMATSQSFDSDCGSGNVDDADVDGNDINLGLERLTVTTEGTQELTDVLQTRPEIVFDSVRVMAEGDRNTKQQEADDWLGSADCMGNVNNFLGQLRKTKTQLMQKHMVKVGILDTGIDLDHPAFKDFTSKQIQRKNCKNFVNPENPPLENDFMDNNGHGTHCAHTILKICQTAQLYVGKVFENEAGDGGSADRIEKAIDWLSQEAEVDIISMSFAFSAVQNNITRAIRRAIGHHDMLFFAAASNNKHYDNDPVGYPAQIEEVIRVNSCDFTGERSHFSPRASNNSRSDAFSTLGEEIKSGYSHVKDATRNRDFKRESGTSMATAVMAGCAGLVLEFVKIKQPGDKTRVEWLHDASNMKAVFFHCMAGKKPPEPPAYTYIRPWLLFNRSRQIEDVAYDIDTAIGKRL